MTQSGRILEQALANYASFPLAEVPPERLPLVDRFAEKHIPGKPFLELDVLFVQHHLGSFPGRLRAMKDCGLDPDRSWFVDIPYSTNGDVTDEMVGLGFSPLQMTPRFDHPLEPYDPAQAKRVSTLMESFEARRDPRPLLVVDDGAYFARYLDSIRDEPERLKLYMGTSIVEQTTRGHRFLCDKALDIILAQNISVVSIARCHTKNTFEGPFIGAAQAQAMLEKVGEDRIKGANRSAIIGGGIVGSATLRELYRINKELRVDLVDIDPSVRSRVSKISEHCEGVSQLLENQEYDLVIGCTGYTSFQLDQRRLLANEAVLASGSSAAIEFNRARFIELADLKPDDEIEVLEKDETVSRGIHAPISLRQEGGKTFTFLNAGFPINFSGKLECVPSKIIQATHGLLFAASLQTLAQSSPGVNTLNAEDDSWILEEAHKELALLLA